jgi:hypothetical protein
MRNEFVTERLAFPSLKMHCPFNLDAAFAQSQVMRRAATNRRSPKVLQRKY